MKLIHVDLGQIGYQEAWDLQVRIAEGVSSGALPDVLLTLEHPPVLTLGANFHSENLPYPESFYIEQGIEIIRTDRGGDITYHGPNQLVAYPIVSLANRGRDLHAWLRNLEEAVIKTLATWEIVGRRFPPHTGVWVDDQKVCAIGIKVKRWTSIHGIALNCNNDLAPFSLIVPCGIKGYGVTSLERLGRPEVTRIVAAERFAHALAGLYDLELEKWELERLESEQLRHLPCEGERKRSIQGVD